MIHDRGSAVICCYFVGFSPSEEAGGEHQHLRPASFIPLICNQCVPADLIIIMELFIRGVNIILQ